MFKILLSESGVILFFTTDKLLINSQIVICPTLSNVPFLASPEGGTYEEVECIYLSNRLHDYR